MGFVDFHDKMSSYEWFHPDDWQDHFPANADHDFLASLASSGTFFLFYLLIRPFLIFSLCALSIDRYLNDTGLDASEPDWFIDLKLLAGLSNENSWVSDDLPVSQYFVSATDLVHFHQTLSQFL